MDKLDLRKADLLIHLSMSDDEGVVAGRLRAAAMLLDSVIGDDAVAVPLHVLDRGPVRNLRLAIDLIQRKPSYGDTADGMLDAVVDVLVPAIETIEDAETVGAR